MYKTQKLFYFDWKKNEREGMKLITIEVEKTEHLPQTLTL